MRLLEGKYTEADSGVCKIFCCLYDFVGRDLGKRETWQIDLRNLKLGEINAVDGWKFDRWHEILLS